MKQLSEVQYSLVTTTCPQRFNVTVFIAGGHIINTHHQLCFTGSSLHLILYHGLFLENLFFSEIHNIGFYWRCQEHWPSQWFGS